MSIPSSQSELCRTLVRALWLSLWGAALTGCGELPTSPTAHLSSLGDNPDFVAGTLADPPLTAPGPGGGEWNSEPASFVNKILVEAAIPFLRSDTAQAQYGPDATGYLLHYFEGNGALKDLAVDRLLAEVPAAQTLVAEITAKAQRYAATLPEGVTTFSSART